MSQSKKVRVQDDLYQYVNGNWMAKAVIPDDKPRVGGFSDLDTNVEKLLMKDFRAMNAGSKPIPSSYLEEAVKLYRKARNIKRRNQEGLDPVKKDLAFLRSLTNLRQFNRQLEKLSFETPLSDPNRKNYNVQAFGGGDIEGQKDFAASKYTNYLIKEVNRVGAWIL